MHIKRFCAKCGSSLNPDGTCPKCAGASGDSRSGIKMSSNVQRPTPVIVPEPKKEEPGKGKNNKWLIILCIVLASLLVIGAAAWIFWPQISGLLGLSNGDENNGPKKSLEVYLEDYAKYTTVDDYSIEENENGETVLKGKVTCPDYTSIYIESYEETHGG